MTETYLAFDLGAESGRAVAGTFDEEGRLHLQEIHRFSNRPVRLRGTLTWDLPGLFRELLEGIRLFSKTFDRPPAGISCDTWGVDFGLLDPVGNPIGNPVHYRDSRTEGMPDRVFARVPIEEIYSRTGTQFMPLNTLFQIESLESDRDPQWELADRFLTMADLFHYLFCEAEVVESSLASTSHLYSARDRDWDWDLIDRLGYPRKKFPTVTPPGTRIGTLDEAIVTDLDLPAAYRNTPVIASLSHDTAAAVAAAPAQPETNWAYLSSGTWSLLGVELSEPILTEEARELNFTNEGGAENTVRFLKNIMGLWVLQECKRAWEREGTTLDYAQIADQASQAEPRGSFIDPDDPRFFTPGDMPERVRAYCRETDQPIPEDIGPVARVVFESLALKYRHNLESIEALTGGKKIEVLHIVGGGGKNRFLNRLVADVLGIPVVVGPTEATATGNLLFQAVAMNRIGGLWEGREIVSRSFEIERIEPGGSSEWEESIERFSSLIGS